MCNIFYNTLYEKQNKTVRLILRQIKGFIRSKKNVNAQHVSKHCKSVSIYLSPDIPTYILFEVVNRKIRNIFLPFLVDSPLLFFIGRISLIEVVSCLIVQRKK